MRHPLLDTDTHRERVLEVRDEVVFLELAADAVERHGRQGAAPSAHLVARHAAVASHQRPKRTLRRVRRGTGRAGHPGGGEICPASAQQRDDDGGGFALGEVVGRHARVVGERIGLAQLEVEPVGQRGHDGGGAELLALDDTIADRRQARSDLRGRRQVAEAVATEAAVLDERLATGGHLLRVEVPHLRLCFGGLRIDQIHGEVGYQVPDLGVREAVTQHARVGLVVHRILDEAEQPVASHLAADHGEIGAERAAPLVDHVARHAARLTEDHAPVIRIGLRPVDAGRVERYGLAL